MCEDLPSVANCCKHSEIKVFALSCSETAGNKQVLNRRLVYNVGLKYQVDIYEAFRIESKLSDCLFFQISSSYVLLATSISHTQRHGGTSKYLLIIQIFVPYKNHSVPLQEPVACVLVCSAAQVCCVILVLRASIGYFT